MSILVFYEKPGCTGNQAQKARLRVMGYWLIVRDLLSEHWTAATLRPFFTDRPIMQWFNLSAPPVKSGEVDIHGLDEQEAIALMIREPLLIRRPLLQLGEIRQSGFGPGPVLKQLKVPLIPDQDLRSCPMTDAIESYGALA